MTDESYERIISMVTAMTKDLDEAATTESETMRLLDLEADEAMAVIASCVAASLQEPTAEQGLAHAFVFGLGLATKYQQAQTLEQQLTTG